jgi:hypothetical protein
VRPPIVTVPPAPGDFLCLPISGSVGRLIEFAQFLAGERFQPYEHVEVYVGLPDAQGPYGYTISAYPGGHGKRALPCAPEAVPGALWSSGLIDLTTDQRVAIVGWAVAHRTVRYSAADYFALAAARLKFHLILPPLRKFIAAKGHLICSQFTTLDYYQAGASLWPGEPWDGLDMPMDLAELLEEKLASHA